MPILGINFNAANVQMGSDGQVIVSETFQTILPAATNRATALATTDAAAKAWFGATQYALVSLVIQKRDDLMFTVLATYAVKTTS